MTQKNEVVTVYLFRDPEPEIGNAQSSEIDDRPAELLSRITAFSAKHRFRDDLSDLDAVISSSLARAQELAGILTGKSLNTARKQEVRLLIEGQLKKKEGLLNIVPNEQYQPVLVLSETNQTVITQIGDVVAVLPPGTKILAVLDRDTLQKLTQQILGRRIELNLNHAEGVKITIGEKESQIKTIK